MGPAEQALTALREDNSSAPSDESSDARSAQALSMLVSLMFDLPMRSALADPMKPTETRAERQERTA